jgi:NAD(P)-dependent dehydrogenase (short-subunit alcohol dehydrogenase family)
MQLTGFEGKNALVTGASRGMGKAIAKVLAKSGAQVVCCAKNQEVLAQTCSEIKKEGGVAIPVKADVAIASDRQRLIEQAIANVKGIDILVNNAGIHIDTPALELTDQEFLDLMQVNFFSMFSLSRDIAKQMIARGGGRIVNMGSISGQGGGSKQVAYCASKAAIEGMTRSLAIEWAKYNINVNTVAPGIIRTDMSRPGWENEAKMARVQSQIPAKRMGEPEDVANLVAFLCSKESSYITGHIYYVDGGVMISR